MTEFVERERQHCRNPKCRSKLPKSVTNPREAFCVRGCYRSFYWHRCLACEEPIMRRASNQKVCRKSKCRAALRVGAGFGRYHTPSNAKRTPEDPDSVGSKQPHTSHRPWRHVAGPCLTEQALRHAAVGGKEAVERTNQTNARYWREANAKAEDRTIIRRLHGPVNILGGYRHPDAPIIVDLRPTRRLVGKPVRRFNAHDLDIPAFLRRYWPEASQTRLAA